MSTMKVKHNPTVDIEKVCEIYSKRDGVPIKYVCTTDLRSSDAPVDIFYRSTPHPQLGIITLDYSLTICPMTL